MPIFFFYIKGDLTHRRLSNRALKIDGVEPLLLLPTLASGVGPHGCQASNWNHPSLGQSHVSVPLKGAFQCG